METILLTIKEHRGSDRLFAQFPKKQALINIVKKVPGARWSQSKVQWHFDLDKQIVDQLKQLFEGNATVDTSILRQQLVKIKQKLNREENSKSQDPNPIPDVRDKEEKIVGSNPTSTPDIQTIPTQSDIESLAEILNNDFEENFLDITYNNPEPSSINVEEKKESDYRLEVTAKKLFLKMPKNEADMAFIRTFKYSLWKNEIHRWSIPNYKSNLEQIKKYFGERLKEIITDDKTPSGSPNSEGLAKPEKRRKQKPGKVDIEIVNNMHIMVYFPFSFDHVKKMKTLPLYYYNADDKSWKFPYSENIISEIERYFKQFNFFIEIKNITSKDSGKKEKKNYGNERKMPEDYLNKLKVMRYSENTISTYTKAFGDFINYYITKDLKEITNDDIKSYLLYLVDKRKISSSFQNQVINAIKFYYEKVLGGKKLPYITIDRPIKEKLLPPVLSVEEVKLIISKITNLKHKAIIMTIYSAGLRISEAINLKIADIDKNRNAIFVKAGKGKKDRYTLLSEKLLVILREYFKQYRPKEYLFEGQDGGKYAQTSIQHIFQRACQEAKILKKVTVHTLRHSFATHLHEAGADIKYIKELLGHSSLKTTEVYTHLTFKAMGQIKSPLDSLDF